MKTTKLLVSLVAIVLSFQGCCLLVPCDTDDDFVSVNPSFSSYEPVLMKRSDLENSIALKDPISITKSGKIYVKDKLLLINEVRKGFHIYDNSNPENPTPIKFLEIPGSTDLAIRDNMLYINQATDLVALDYDAESQNVSITKRIINTFPELISPEGVIAYDIMEDDIVIDWKLKD